MVNYARSPYEILGISADATRKEIKRRYRLLAKQFHPDCASGDPEAEAKFKEIQWAYETLSVEGSEKTTNRTARHSARPYSAGYEDGHPFSGFFWALRAYSSRIRHQKKEKTTIKPDEAGEP